MSWNVPTSTRLSGTTTIAVGRFGRPMALAMSLSGMSSVRTIGNRSMYMDVLSSSFSLSFIFSYSLSLSLL